MIAQEAKDMADSIDLAQIQFDGLLSNIEYRASIGDHSLWQEYIYPKTKKLLRKQGYSVMHIPFLGYTISWK